MGTFLKYFQLIVGLFLMAAILIQTRANGLNSQGGSTSNFQTTRRGAEKFVYNATVIFAVLFVFSSIAVNYIK